MDKQQTFDDYCARVHTSTVYICIAHRTALRQSDAANEREQCGARCDCKQFNPRVNLPKIRCNARHFTMYALPEHFKRSDVVAERLIQLFEYV